MSSIVSSAVLIGVLVVASWLDVRTRRIPNTLTVFGLAAALVLRGFLGPGAVFTGLGGAGLALLVALPPFALGMLGGGDVKLLAAVGGFVGTGELLGTLLTIAVLGGGLALFEAIRRRVLLKAVANTYGFAKQWLLLGRAGVVPTIASPHALTVPYGVAIAGGTLTWWFLTGAQL